MLPVSKNAVLILTQTVKPLIAVKHFNILTQNLGTIQVPSTPRKHICYRQLVCENSKDISGEKEVQN